MQCQHGVGDAVAATVGDGACVGDAVGVDVGEGNGVGDGVGVDVGEGVGAPQIFLTALEWKTRPAASV